MNELAIETSELPEYENHLRVLATRRTQANDSLQMGKPLAKTNWGNYRSHDINAERLLWQLFFRDINAGG